MPYWKPLRPPPAPEWVASSFSSRSVVDRIDRQELKNRPQLSSYNEAESSRIQEPMAQHHTPGFPARTCEQRRALDVNYFTTRPPSRTHDDTSQSLNKSYAEALKVFNRSVFQGEIPENLRVPPSRLKQDILATRMYLKNSSTLVDSSIHSGELNTAKHLRPKSLFHQVGRDNHSINNLCNDDNSMDEKTVKSEKKGRSTKKPFIAPVKAVGSNTTGNGDNRRVLQPKIKLCERQTKKSPETQICDSPQKPRINLMNMAKLSQETTDDVSDIIKSAEEVAMSIFYENDSPANFESAQIKRRKLEKTQPSGIIVAYPKMKSDGSSRMSLAFLLLPFCKDKGTSTVYQRVKGFLGTLMKSATRKLCFDAQKLIQIVCRHFQFPANEVCYHWKSFVDPKIAQWLLDSDNAPQTLECVVEKYSKQETSVNSRVDKEYKDLHLLGPTMLQLYHKLTKVGLWDLYSNVEMKLTPILASMNLHGIRVNSDKMKNSGDTLQEKLKLLEDAAHDAAGHPFLLNSHQQLRHVLFEELQLDSKLCLNKKTARTSGNQKSTSEAVLTQLENIHPLPGIILEYRQVYKMKSTYVDGMLSNVTEDEIHPSWEQTSAVTGRLASMNPNIQSIPKQPITIDIQRQSLIRGKEEERCTKVVCARSPFICRDGYSFVAADFQQIEFRLLAHLTKDTTLLRAFNDGVCPDIFIGLASLWLKKDYEAVTGNERERTKRMVYSAMYGAGKDRIAEHLKVTPTEAHDILKSFLGRFPCISTFTKSCIEVAKKLGYQTTILNRRRQLPHINHPNPVLRAQAERQAVNFCVQGSAADLCKAAMIKITESLKRKELVNIRMLMQIHDELLFEVPDENVREACELMRTIMEDSSTLCDGSTILRVPLKVSLCFGKSWGQMTDFIF